MDSIDEANAGEVEQTTKTSKTATQSTERRSQTKRPLTGDSDSEGLWETETEEVAISNDRVGLLAVD